MAQAIDGMLDVGAVSVGSISLDPGSNLIGRVIVEKGTTVNQAEVVNGVLQTTGEVPGNTGTNNSVAVGTSATLLVAVAANRKVFTISNPEDSDATNIMYVGASGITVGKGIAVLPGETFVDTESSDAWYGIFAVAGLTCPTYHNVKT